MQFVLKISAYLYSPASKISPRLPYTLEACGITLLAHVFLAELMAKIVRDKCRKIGHLYYYFCVQTNLKESVRRSLISAYFIPHTPGPLVRESQL